MREMTIDSTELRQLVTQEINLISDDEMAGLYQLIHYFRLGSQIASNGAMVSNNGYHPELLNSPEELNAREDTMDSTNENKGASTDDCITHTSSTNESDIDDDLEEALRAQGWTRPSLFKDDPEFFKLFDEIEEERNRHWVGDNKADWLIFGEAALRAGNFRSLDQIISQALDAWFKQLPSELRWDIAIDLYTSEEISSGKAAEIAGLNYFVFLEELRAHGIKFIGAEMPEGEEREKQDALLDELMGEKVMDSTGEGKGKPSGDGNTCHSSTNESDIDDDLEEALRAQGWTRPSLFKDDPEFFKLFDEIEEERNRHWVGGE